MSITNNTNLHLSLAVWLASDSYDHDFRPNAISATGLLKPLRQIILSQRVAEMENKTSRDLDVTDLIPSSLGTAIHDSCEFAWSEGNHIKTLRKLGYPAKVIDRIMVNPTKADFENTPNLIPIYIEQRSERTLGDFIITGKFDAIMDGQVIDYKSTSAWKWMHLADSTEEFVLQESIYRWLNEDKVTNETGLINFIFTDWKKLDFLVQGKKGYPDSRVKSHKITLMSVKEIEQYMSTKLADVTKYQKTEQESLPLCTAKELWQQKSKFQYFKNPQGKRATRNYDSFAEAQTHLIKDGSVGLVKEKKAMAKRCGFCAGAEICQQRQQLINDGLFDPEG